MDKRRRAPVVLDLEADTLPAAPLPADAPPVSDIDPPSAAERALSAARGRRGLSFVAKLFWSALAALIGLAIALWFDALVRDLFARDDWLGWAGVALITTLGLSLAILVLRELAGLARLERIEGFRRNARRAIEETDPAAAEQVLKGLDRLYSGRDDLSDQARRMAEAASDTPGALERIEVAERIWLRPLDAEAERTIARAARDVAGATAIIPIPVIDVLAVLWFNLRMIRRVAEVYGGRSGWLESWRLLKAVAAHLAATGVIAAADDIVGPLVGGGVLSKVSRRFGEATVNAALSVRVGVAAAEVCRPLPFMALKPPRARSVLSRALKDWQTREAAD